MESEISIGKSVNESLVKLASSSTILLDSLAIERINDKQDETIIFDQGLEIRPGHNDTPWQLLNQVEVLRKLRL